MSKLNQPTSQPLPNVPRPGPRPVAQRIARVGPATATSVACAVGFREARDRLLAQFEPAAAAPAADAPPVEAWRTAARAGEGVRRAHPLGTCLSWLLSAAAIGWMLFGLANL